MQRERNVVSLKEGNKLDPNENKVSKRDNRWVETTGYCTREKETFARSTRGSKLSEETCGEHRCHEGTDL